MMFAYPFLLAGLLVLPLAYRWMRALPGGETVVSFAAMMFLGPSRGPVKTVKKTPLWLILLRLALLALLILWAAGPQRVPEGQGAPSPTLIVVDTSWSADVSGTLSDITAFFDRYPAADVHIMTTDQTTSRPMTAEGWTTYQRTLALSPYQTTDTGKILSERTDKRAVLYYAPMRYGAQQQGIVDGLRQSQNATLVLPSRTSCAALADVQQTATGIQATLNNRCPMPLQADLYDVETGQRLAETKGTGDTLTFPPASGNGGARVVTIRGEDHFAGRWLLPASLSGKVAVVHAAGRPQGLLQEATYITKALETSGHTVVVGSVSALRDDDIATWILADAVVLDQETQGFLTTKVESGATLIRFWGPRLDALTPQQRDALFPDTPRFQARQLGTVLAWQSALKSQLLSPPLRGGGEDITIMRQILPESETAVTLARLSDQTPWITARTLGKGQIVLIHTGLMPEWGNLATSGSFVPLLTSLASFSGPAESSPAAAELPLQQRLMPDGGLQKDTGFMLRPSDEGTRPTNDHPAGLYGNGASMIPHNIAPFLANEPPMETVLRPQDTLPFTVRKVQETSLSRDLRPRVLQGIVAVFVLELLAVLALHFRRVRVTAAAMMVWFLVAALPAGAREAQIGYLQTGQASMDQTTARALEVLIQETLTRTNMPVAPKPLAISFQTPLSEWLPLMMVYGSPESLSLAPEDFSETLRQYTAGDGLIVLDTRGGANPLRHQSQVASLQPLARALGLVPLQPVSSQHVLHHSYYLLPKLGGLWPGLSAMGAAPQGSQEGVFSMIVLGSDLAGGLLSSDPEVREASVRTGINLMMYAATTTYKDDQIHIDSIMKRLKP
jgi:uncharacterized membrane protein